jgi:hypothetical protein
LGANTSAEVVEEFVSALNPITLPADQEFIMQPTNISLSALCSASLCASKFRHGLPALEVFLTT